MIVRLEREAVWGVPALCLPCQVSLGCLEHNALTINASTAKPLALTGRVAVSGNRHILYNVKAQHSAALRTLLIASVVCQKGRAERSFSSALSSCRTFSDLNFVFSHTSPTGQSPPCPSQRPIRDRPEWSKSRTTPCPQQRWTSPLDQRSASLFLLSEKPNIRVSYVTSSSSSPKYIT